MTAYAPASPSLPLSASVEPYLILIPKWPYSCLRPSVSLSLSLHMYLHLWRVGSIICHMSIKFSNLSLAPSVLNVVVVVCQHTLYNPYTSQHGFTCPIKHFVQFCVFERGAAANSAVRPFVRKKRQDDYTDVIPNLMIINESFSFVCMCLCVCVCVGLPAAMDLPSSFYAYMWCTKTPPHLYLCPPPFPLGHCSSPRII